MTRRQPVRPCLHHGCTAYAMPGCSRCAEHERELPRSPSSVATRKMPHRRRRAAILRSGPPWLCSDCLKLIGDASEVELDHVTPLARGGTDDPSNVRVLCRACNRRKGEWGTTPAACPTRFLQSRADAHAVRFNQK